MAVKRMLNYYKPESSLNLAWFLSLWSIAFGGTLAEKTFYAF